ncbi:TonB-dependent receptor plug domain-containing protein [Halosquirtibacter xylanolyticus]|uniref:TonB-dependent receptor n=1 Tax=Halosquirtibacter xylanolyticus TaxID=3374599 RepID=UPI003748BC73|nr:TonB-dependent receptor plug domain-containing protein [Prolixibacteraceae bacterium]
MKKIRGLLVLMLWSCILLAQSEVDTIIVTQDVPVYAKYIFNVEEAGMVKSNVDSTVMSKNIRSSLSTLLSENTPIFIKTKGNGALASASFRGTAASHTQVRWNGLNINSPMTGMVDFSLIPVFFVDAVSLEHGGASIASQSGGLGGVVNLNNKVQWSDPFEARYVQFVGDYHTYQEYASIGFGSKKVQSKTRFYHSQSKNDYPFLNRQNFDHIDPNTGEFIHPVDTYKNGEYLKYGLMQELYWRPSDKDVVSACYWGQYADRGIPTVISNEGLEDTNVNNQIDKVHRGVVQWKHYGEDSKIEVKTGGSRKQLFYTLKNQVGGNGATNAIDSKSIAYQLQNSVTYSTKFLESFYFTGSVDLNKSWVDTYETVKKTGYVEDLDVLSVYTSLSKSFGERLNVTGQVRNEWQDNVYSSPIWFVGFDFKVSKAYGLIVHGSFSKNYHRPTLNDLYWQPGGNPDLLPEDGHTAEFGLKGVLGDGDNHLKWSITSYYSDIDNWILWIPSFKGYWEPRNVKNVISKGVETQLLWNRHWGDFNLKIRGDYAYTRSINMEKSGIWGDESYKKQLVYIPVHSANLWFRFDYKWMNISYQYNYFSERFTTTSNEPNVRQWLYPYHMNELDVGACLYKKGDRMVQVKLTISNLFDEVYHSILFSPMPGRNYGVTMILNI